MAARKDRCGVSDVERLHLARLLEHACGPENSLHAADVVIANPDVALRALGAIEMPGLHGQPTIWSFVTEPEGRD